MFLFFINSSKNLIFEVRLRIVRHHISRHCIVRLLRIIRLFCEIVDYFEILASDYW